MASRTSRSAFMCRYIPRLVQVLEPRCLPALLAPQMFSLGGEPSGFSIADVNNDGAMDVVATVANKISVTYGMGDGTLMPPIVYDPSPPAGDYNAPGIGDFNGDSLPDIVAVNWHEDTVTLMTQTVNGAFVVAGVHPVGDYPNDLVVGDVNDDGALDIVTANRSKTIGVLLNQGNGDFEPVKTFSAGEGPRYLVLEELTGDAYLDVAVANTGGPPLAILRGVGDGTFDAPVLHNFLINGDALASGDLNGDGTIDLVTGRSDGFVDILLGNGNGTFAVPVKYKVSANVNSIAIVDLNNDSIPDLATTGYAGPAPMNVLLGNGNGTFQSPSAFGLGGHAPEIAAADFNNDGLFDLATIRGWYTGVASLYINPGTGVFAASRIINLNASANKELLVDLNSDGNLDIVTANPEQDNLAVLLGLGDGRFKPAVFIAVPDPNSVASGDFNEDSAPDLAVVSLVNTNLTILLNNGNGTFQPSKTYSGVQKNGGLAVGDVNGDQKLDILVAGSKLWWYRGNGNGRFRLFDDVPTQAAPGGVVLADVSNDGITDVVVSHTLNRMGVILGNGDLTFKPEVIYSTGSYGNTHFTVADLDADGDIDIAAGSDVLMGVLMNNGNGTFQPAVFYPINKGPYGVVAADIDKDGALDLITANFYGFGVSVLLNRGNGTFRPQMAFETGDPVYGIAIGDVNGDGWTDVLTSLLYDKKLSVTLNDGNWRRSNDSTGDEFNVDVNRTNFATHIDAVALWQCKKIHNDSSISTMSFTCDTLPVTLIRRKPVRHLSDDSISAGGAPEIWLDDASPSSPWDSRSVAEPQRRNVLSLDPDMTVFPSERRTG